MRRLVAPPAAAALQAGEPPSFSVLIPTYQAATMITDAVESALRQTRPPLEVIVCDDGSTDDTASVLDPYRDRIVFIRKDNGGAASALNACLRQSRGDFAFLLDADDVLEATALESLAELAALRPDLDIVMTDTAFIREGVVVARLTDETPFPTSDQRLAILDRCFILHPAVRSSRIRDVGGFDESFRVVHDWDCWIRLLLSGSIAGLVDEPLYRYRVHAQSLTANRPADLTERVRMLEKVRRRGDLDRLERQALEASCRRHRPRATLARAEETLRTRASGRRRAALSVAFGRGFSHRTRAKALAAALRPEVAAGLLEDRARAHPSHLDRPLFRE